MARIERRCAHLRERIAKNKNGRNAKQLSYDVAELSAFTWALEELYDKFGLQPPKEES